MQAGRLSTFVEAIIPVCFCDSLLGFGTNARLFGNRGCYSQSGFAFFQMSLDIFQLSGHQPVWLFGKRKAGAGF